MILLASVSFSYVFESANFTIYLEKSGKARFNLTLPGQENEIDLLLQFDIENAVTECEYRKTGAGTVFRCPPSNLTTISGTLVARAIQKKDLRVLTVYFPVSNVYKRFAATVYLPEGTVLAPEKKTLDLGFLPAEPSPYTTVTDGRRIGVVWNFSTPELGKTIVFRVAYESKRPLWILLAIPLSMLAAYIAFVVMKRVDSTVLKVLDKDEKAVYEIILSRGKVTQNVVVRETGMSKAKVSRIIRRLEEKSLIEKTRKGRVNVLEVARK